jgi:hypothetical protein
MGVVRDASEYSFNDFIADRRRSMRSADSSTTAQILIAMGLMQHGQID